MNAFPAAGGEFAPYCRSRAIREAKNIVESYKIPLTTGKAFCKIKTAYPPPGSARYITFPVRATPLGFPPIAVPRTKKGGNIRGPAVRQCGDLP